VFEGASSPYQPEKLIAYNISHRHAMLQWTAPRIKYTSEHYLVHIGRMARGLERKLTTNTTSLDLIDLEENTDYLYRVEAVNSVGSTLTEVKHFKTTSRMFAVTDQDDD